MSSVASYLTDTTTKIREQSTNVMPFYLFSLVQLASVRHEVFENKHFWEIFTHHRWTIIAQTTDRVAAYDNLFVTDNQLFRESLYETIGSNPYVKENMLNRQKKTMSLFPFMDTIHKRQAFYDDGDNLERVIRFHVWTKPESIFAQTARRFTTMAGDLIFSVK